MLYIIRGVPGSGKSTLAYDMMDRGLIDMWFEADMFFYNDKEEYVFDHNKLKEAHNWCFKDTVGELISGSTVAVANTFTRLWEMKPYIDFCEEHSIRFQVITCEGLHPNVHGVPDEKVKEMRQRFERY